MCGGMILLSLAVGLDDYLEVIQQPMDLSTIETKLDTGVYKEPKEMLLDVRCKCILRQMYAQARARTCANDCTFKSKT